MRRMRSKFLVLDAFSGGGGLTEGFIRHSFDFLGHIEMDKYAATTLETRLLYHQLYKSGKGDLYRQYYCGEIEREPFILSAKDEGIEIPPVINKELSDTTNDAIIHELKKSLKEDHPGQKVDVIIGGPPCQSFSLAGRGKNGKKPQPHDDPRNYLYKHYLRFLKEFQPRLFIFENVPGMISAREGTIFSDVKAGCAEVGYHLDEKPHFLNASDFGVLQDRKRVIFIGWKKDDKDLSYPEFPPVERDGIVNDLLRDLHWHEAGEGGDTLQSYRPGPPSKYLKDKKLRTEDFKGVRHHAARMHNERDRAIYRIAIEKWDNSSHRLNYDELPPKLRTHENTSSFLDRFKVVNGKGISHAILAHLAKDGHYFIHPDLTQARSLTVREAARIQSFPDDYLFEGPRSAKYVQIGNAVPPLMAEGIAEKIERMLRLN